MNPLTLEWIEKAEGDFITAGRELRARKLPNYDASCFHSQQAAEKYVKAMLQEKGQLIPRTHNLIDLLTLCLPVDPSIKMIQPNLLTLNGYATRFRYPGETADKTEAKTAYQSALTVRNVIRARLGI